MTAEPEQKTPAPVADRDWHREARIQFIKDVRCRNAYNDTHDYKAGDELHMVQFGRAGREVDTYWWSSYDIDGAFIVPDDAVHVLEVTRDCSPRT